MGGLRWLNFFGWQRPSHGPPPRPAAPLPQPERAAAPPPEPDRNPLGWSREALALMADLEELFD